jgi:DNA-directed RNA polymerase delta subunit
MTAKFRLISYAELVNTMLDNLPEREREVLQRRNALGQIAEAHTLEQIGQDFNITRERVRQIEREGLKKLKGLDFLKLKLPVTEIEEQVQDHLKANGGLMSEEHLVEKLIMEREQKEEDIKAINFVLANLIAEKFVRVDDLADYETVWTLNHVDLAEAQNIAEALKGLITDHGQPLHIEDILNKFQTHNLYKKIEQNEAENQAIVEALLRTRKDVRSNILKQWGLSIWNTIKPKRMTDKAYLIMLREKRPLHFAEVADLINQALFDGKKACPATVHNELILDDKYVLVGRGIYALKEWGYQAGTVSDIITAILQQEGPQTKQELMDKVLKQRLVQKTTIVLALMSKERFEKMPDGRYALAK